MTDSEDLRAAIHMAFAAHNMLGHTQLIDNIEALFTQALTKERQQLRIATACPACKHTSLILSADNWLVCGNLECNDPAAINNQQSKGE